MSTEDPKDEIIDIEPQVIEDQPAAAKPKRNFGAAKVAGLCVGVGVLCAVAGGWAYRDMLSGYLPSDQLQAMQTKIDALEAASKDSQKRADAFVALTEELKAQLGAAQSASQKSEKQNADTAAQSQQNASSITDMKQALDQASKTLDELKAQVAANGTNTTAAPIPDPTLASRVTELEKDVAALKAAPAAKAPVASASPGIDIAAAQQAFGALKDKIAQGQPYLEQFNAVQALVPAAAGLDVIGANATAGVPNATQLAQELSGIVPSLPKPAAAAPASHDSWWDRITGVFSDLVTVKTVGEGDVSVVAARALAALQLGDLKTASDAMASATSPLPEPLKVWSERLQRRIKLEQALAALESGLSHITQAKG